MTDTADIFERLYAAERALRENEEAFFGSGEPDALSRAVAAAVEGARKLEPGNERSVRLYRLAMLCAELPGPEPIDALLDILDEEDLTARTEAGESLLELAYERYKEVAASIEARLAKNHEGPSMEELPFILTEVFDPDPVPLVARFLAHPKADVVGAAIEALATYGDPAAVPKLRPLARDTRTLIVPDLEGGEATIGELASEAIASLSPEPRPPSRPHSGHSGQGHSGGAPRGSGGRKGRPS
jgi:HEAT repeat protein